MLFYTIVIAMVLTVFFDLSWIAALGAIFYLIMDIAIHWGVLRYLREEVGASSQILVNAMMLDVVVLGAFLTVKAQTDIFIIIVGLIGLAVVFAGEWLFLRFHPPSSGKAKHHH